MQNILVYDTSEENLQEVADQNDVTVADVVEAMLDYINANNIDISEIL